MTRLPGEVDVPSVISCCAEHARTARVVRPKCTCVGGQYGGIAHSNDCDVYLANNGRYAAMRAAFRSPRDISVTT